MLADLQQAVKVLIIPLNRLKPHHVHVCKCDTYPNNNIVIELIPFVLRAHCAHKFFKRPKNFFTFLLNGKSSRLCIPLAGFFLGVITLRAEPWQPLSKRTAHALGYVSCSMFDSSHFVSTCSSPSDAHRTNSC